MAKKLDMIMFILFDYLNSKIDDDISMFKNQKNVF